MNDQAPVQRRTLIWAIVAFAIFAGCCAVIYWGHAWVSQSAVATYALLAVAAVSVFAGPILVGRAGFAAFLGRVQRGSGRKF